MPQQPKPPQQPPPPPPRPGPSGPSQPAGTPQSQQHPNPQPPGGGEDYEQSRHKMGGEGQAEHDTRPQHPSGEIHPDTPSVGAPPAEGDPAKALEKKREEEWKESDEEEQEAEKDFKLPKIGARDYVAGQPVDDKELQDTIKENKQRKETGRKAFKEGHTPDKTHSAWVEQYGQPTGSGGGPGQSKGQSEPTGVGVKAP